MGMTARESNTQTPSVLTIDDEANQRFVVSEMLGLHGFSVLEAASGEEGLRLARESTVPIILLDLAMPGIGGMDVLGSLGLLRPVPKVIMLTGQGTVQKAAEAMKLGAFDFLTKPVDEEQLVSTVQDALAAHEAAEPGKAPVSGAEDPTIIGADLEPVLELLDRVATTDIAVMLVGETGTGKELFARRLHRRSARSEGSLVAVNCGALAEGLIESELFGHEKGAFTGAFERKLGLFEVASEGTLLLDEISDLPASTQATLLRVVESGEFRRVGSTEVLHTAARLVAASSQSLSARVEDGTFREDLYYRLNGIEIHLPPLRDRLADLPDLVDHFLRELGPAGKDRPCATPEAMAALRARPWPGNVRELRQVLARATALRRGPAIGPEDLQLQARPQPAGHSSPEILTLHEVERAHILDVISQVRGNISAAARALGIPRNTLYRRLKAF